MRFFGTLFRYELKKLLKKGYVRAALSLILLLALALNLYPLLQTEQVAYLEEDGTVVVEEVGYYEEVQLERRFAAQYNGTQLTNELAAYSHQLNMQYLGQTRLDESFYLPLLNTRLIYRSLTSLGINPDAGYPDTGRDDLAELGYQELSEQTADCTYLSDAEQDYWADAFAQLSTPMTMYYAKGYSRILELSYWLSAMALFFVSLCLAASFAEENACRTEAIVQSARFGRLRLAAAKLAAGEAVAAGTVLLLFGMTAVIQLAIHGVSGWNAPVQLLGSLGYTSLSACGYALNAGEAVLLTAAVSLLLALCLGALTLLFSRLLRQTVAALAVSAGVLLLPPALYSFTSGRAAHQLLSYFPLLRLSLEYDSGVLLTDWRTVNAGGVLLNAVQTSFLVYSVLTLLLLLVCIVLCRAAGSRRQCRT